jgi:hypothetical protein
MNTYNWIITALECKPEFENKTNVVVTAHWRLNATDGINNTDVHGTQNFSLNENSSFTSFSDLTKDQVVGWIQSSMGNVAVAELKTRLDNQINNLVNPPVVFPDLPWLAD